MVTLPRTLPVLAVLILFAAQVFAQRYQEHDHTVFHRPAPPAKHQSATPAAAATNHPAAANNSGTMAHTSDPARHHDVTFNSPPGSTESRTAQAPQPGK